MALAEEGWLLISTISKKKLLVPLVLLRCQTMPECFTDVFYVTFPFYMDVAPEKSDTAYTGL